MPSDDEEEVSQQLLEAKEVLDGRWAVIRKLGSGGFGQIYLATDQKHQIVVALKVEIYQPRDQSQLPMELQVMKRCQGQRHAVQLHGAGRYKNLNFIAMQLLGENLGNLRRKSPLEPHRFSLNSTLRLGMQCLESVRDLHSADVLHRDIKPSDVCQFASWDRWHPKVGDSPYNETVAYMMLLNIVLVDLSCKKYQVCIDRVYSPNFAMGLEATDKKDIVYILDFGLARFHRDANGRIRKQRSQAGFRGTIRYCSIASHLRQDLGRKDDVLSLFYVLTEFWLGKLPWRDLDSHSDVLASKKQHSPEKLAAQLHPQMVRFISYVEKLKYNDVVCYDFLIQILDFIFKMKRYNHTDPWDWENSFKFLTEEQQRQSS